MEIIIKMSKILLYVIIWVFPAQCSKLYVNIFLASFAKLSQAPAPAPAGRAELALFSYNPTTPTPTHPGKFILDTACIQSSS